MKIKLHITGLIFFTLNSMNSFSQEFSPVLISGTEIKNASPDFEKTKGKMINFHMTKVVDHQKVVDCLKKSVDFESMNACNVHLEKYIKKNVEEAKNQEEKE